MINGGYTYNLAQRWMQVVSEFRLHSALKYPSGEVYSFEYLNTRANEMASFLLGHGIKSGDVIALLSNKSAHTFAMMIACLKLGVIYTNLDPESPLERIQKITDRCKPVMSFGDEGIPEQWFMQQLNGKSIFSLAAITGSSKEPAQNYNHHGNSPAYIMFTSGSTGFPKGAVMSHQNLLNLCDWAKTTFNITDKTIATNINPVYFDNSVFDFYSSIFNGACMVPFNSAQVRQPLELIKQVTDIGCTQWFSVPSMLVYLLTTRAISSGCMPDMRYVIFGGEGFPKSRLRELYDRIGSHATLVNVYGPTECTCICSSYVISEVDFEDMQHIAPLGYLAPNFAYEILEQDETGIGELALKGPNVGLGYFNDPERTAKSFIQNPNNQMYQETIYRTGDLVTEDESGKLHFKGRADNQIKHMGYRIELEEIESNLNSLEGVKESAAIYQVLGPGMGQILCYAAVLEGHEDTNYQELLKSKLPDYMVPRKVVTMAELPKNQNGKTDRHALKQLN